MKREAKKQADTPPNAADPELRRMEAADPLLSEPPRYTHKTWPGVLIGGRGFPLPTLRDGQAAVAAAGPSLRWMASASDDWRNRYAALAESAEDMAADRRESPARRKAARELATLSRQYLAFGTPKKKGGWFALWRKGSAARKHLNEMDRVGGRMQVLAVRLGFAPPSPPVYVTSVTVVSRDLEKRFARQKQIVKARAVGGVRQEGAEKAAEAEWVKRLASKVGHLVRNPDILKRFHEMKDQWQKRNREQTAAKTAWQDRRRQHFERLAGLPPDDPQRAESTKPPKRGKDWVWEGEYVFSSGEKEFIWGGVPPGLAQSGEPEVKPILPLEKRRSLEDDEKYMLLAVVHDEVLRGVKEIAPWPGSILEAIPYAALCYEGRNEPDLDGLLDHIKDAEVELRGFLEDVKEDLRKCGLLPPKAAGAEWARKGKTGGKENAAAPRPTAVDRAAALIVKVFQDRPDAEKREYLKAAAVLVAVKEKHPAYDRKLITIQRALTALAKTGTLESKTNAGYRLPPK